MCGLAILVVGFVITGGALFAAFGAITGARLILSDPNDMAGALSLAVYVAYGVVGAAFWWVVGRLIGRPPRDWFGPSYPVTSLRRDDLRTARWLDLLATTLRSLAAERRAEIAEHTGRDPGPQFPARLADHVDDIRRLYAAGDYAEANKLQKQLANWVARMGRGADAEAFYSPTQLVQLREDGESIMALWKRLWIVAADVKASEETLRALAAAPGVTPKPDP